VTQTENCPFCGSRSIFPAQFVTDEAGAATLLRFPAIERFAWWKFASAGNEDAFRDVHVGHPNVCLGCGMLWAKYDLQRTCELVERHGSDEIKAALGIPDDKTRPTSNGVDDLALVKRAQATGRAPAP